MIYITVSYPYFSMQYGICIMSYLLFIQQLLALVLCSRCQNSIQSLIHSSWYHFLFHPFLIISQWSSAPQTWTKSLYGLSVPLLSGSTPVLFLDPLRPNFFQSMSPFRKLQCNTLLLSTLWRLDMKVCCKLSLYPADVVLSQAGTWMCLLQWINYRKKVDINAVYSCSPNNRKCFTENEILVNHSQWCTAKKKKKCFVSNIGTQLKCDLIHLIGYKLCTNQLILL